MLSKVIYDAMEQIIGDRDNINPTLLINSATDFSNFDFANFQDASDSLSASQSQAESSTTPGPNTGIRNESRGKNKGKGKGKKRKHSPSPEPKLIDLLTRKWENEEKERKLDREARQKEIEAREKHADEMMGALRMTLESIARLAKD